MAHDTPGEASLSMRARLIVETGAASPQVSDLLSTQTIRLGRNSKNNIVLGDPHASRWHAEIYNDNNRWYVRDCVTTNGTKVNGVKIDKPVLLENNHVVSIGDARMRFALDSSAEGTAELPIVAEPLKSNEEPHVVAAAGSDISQTILHADELTALLHFMTASLTETTLHGLVHLGLTAVLKQTLANVAGFLSLDAEEPQYRLVLPAEAEVDTQLSRQLTQTVLRENRAVWLGAPRSGNLDSESLVAFRDAVGIPLRIGQALPAETSAEPLGALHIYKANRLFSEREVRFCEVLAGC